MNAKSRLINLVFRLVKPSPKTQQSPGTEFRWWEWLASILEFKEYLDDKQGVMKLSHLPFTVSSGGSVGQKMEGDIKTLLCSTGLQHHLEWQKSASRQVETSTASNFISGLQLYSRITCATDSSCTTDNPCAN